MDFKNLLAQLDQLNEATKETGKGRIHTAEPGGYGRKDDEDDEGNKVKAVSTEKKGKGRPKKATQSSGEDKKYDFSAFGVKHGKDIKLPKYDKKKTTKHSLKDWIEQVDRGMIAEAEQVQIKPATQTQTQVIQQGNKTLGTVTNPALAATIKSAIGKGEMNLNPDQQMKEEDIGKHNNANTGFEALVRKLTPKYGVEAAKRIAGAQLKKIREADMPPNDSIMSPISEARAKADDKAEKAGKKVTKDIEYDEKKKDGIHGKKRDAEDAKAERAGKKVAKDIEYDEKKKKTVKEAAKPDFLDLDKDGNKKESMKKAADDKKKKVKEGMEHRLKAAHHSGRAHALAQEGYNCRYDDMEEARQYHEGYKQGLDECYGQMPGMGYVGENNMTTIDDMASYGAHTPQIADEGNAFTAALKKTPQGGKFSVGGKTFTDRSTIEESPWSINEDVTLKAWDNKLNSLLAPSSYAKPTIREDEAKSKDSKSDAKTKESIKKALDNMTAEQLLSIVRQTGLAPHLHDVEALGAKGPKQVGSHGPDIPVDSHEAIINLIRTLTLQPDELETMDAKGKPAGKLDVPKGPQGYENSFGPKDEEEVCDDCGHSDCECDSEDINEDETLDQREEEVAESEEVVNNNDEADEEQSDATRDAALATAASKNFANTDAPITEWANDAGKNAKDESFDADMEYMLNAISGGLNGKKSTGQSTIPVVSTQLSRLGNPVSESNDLLSDWKKLSGIK